MKIFSCYRNPGKIPATLMKNNGNEIRKKFTGTNVCFNDS